jgi:hypothetical protein
MRTGRTRRSIWAIRGTIGIEEKPPDDSVRYCQYTYD